MLRVLQLLSRESPPEAAHATQILCDYEGNDIESLSGTIGRGGEFRNAVQAALRLRFERAFNLIHAWDPQALIAAVASGLPVVYSAAAPLSRGTWSWVAAMAYHDVQVVVDSHAARARQLRSGIPPERCQVVPPAIDLDRTKADSTERLRELLGLFPQDRVVLAPGESTPAGGHKLTLHATSILHVLDERYRLLVWGRGRQTGVLASLARKLRQPRLLVDAHACVRRPIEFEELLPAADLALVTPVDMSPVLPTLICAAAGLPIVATDTPLLREFLTDQSANLVPPDSPRLLAQAMLALFESADRRTQLVNAARASVHRFSQAAFIESFHALYGQVTDQQAMHPAPMREGFGETFSPSPGTPGEGRGGG